MGKITFETKQRIVTMFKANNRPHQICEILSEGISIGEASMRRLVARHKKGDPLVPKNYKQRYMKVTEEHKAFMVQHFKVWRNRRYSLRESSKILKEQLGITISRSTLSRHKRAIGHPMGPVDRRPMTRGKNQPLRTQFAQRLINTNHKLDKFLFVDESSFQTHGNRKFGTRHVFKDKYGKTKHNGKFCVPVPKHPLKVHVWAGISRRGPTDIVIFNGIMDAQFYTYEVLPTNIKSAGHLYPHGDAKMWADNDPKHTSKKAQEYMLEMGISGLKTPAKSPDMNPIENVWKQLKDEVNTVGPTTQDELCEAILKAWGNITVADCNKYINHVRAKIVQGSCCCSRKGNWILNIY